MKYLPMTQAETRVLSQYGLSGIPLSECRHVLFEAGDVIAREGMSISSFYIILKGKARAYKASRDGKSLTICRFFSEGILGEVELLTDEKAATTTVTAITDFECISIAHARCHAELKTNIAFSNKLCAVLAGRLIRSTDNYVSSALLPAKQRLCAYILENANNGFFSDALTEVAAASGISYRHVLRLLNGLCAKGLLEKQGGGYRILDEAGLDAQGD